MTDTVVTPADPAVKIDEPILNFVEAIRFKLPDALIEICIQGGHNISAAKWLIARALAAYVASLPDEDTRELYRDDVIQQAAIYVGVEPSSIGEWLRTAEIIPVGTEDDERYALLGFSHFARAARIGVPEIALNVLEIATKRQALIDPGRPPTCLMINDIVAEMRARISGAAEAELAAERRKKQGRQYFTVVAIYAPDLDAVILPVPHDPHVAIKAGDRVEIRAVVIP